MASPTQDRVFKFGIFELDTHQHELRRQGIHLKLQEQPCQILAVLLENAGEIVSREEIRRRLWPTDTFVDFNNSVNAAVNRLREALGDSADNPRFIETVPRRGYRFIAPVEVPGRLAIAPQKTFVVEGRGAKRTSKTFAPRMAAAVAAMILLALAASVFVRNPVRENTTVPEIRSIVVLPLENLSGDPSQEYFASGMTEEVTTRLAQVPMLRVVSHTSAERYRGSKKPVSEIAKELKVDAILEGAVMKSGDRVRISAQLIYAPADRHLWAQMYDRDLQDVLALQEEISGAIARQIRLKLGNRSETQGHARSVNPEAFDLYLQARYHSNRVTREDTEKSVSLLENAVALDPAFALGYSELARAYRQKAFYFSAEPDVWQERSFVNVEKALSLDPNLAEAHLARGFLLWSHYQHFAHEAAIQEYRRALEIDPNLDEAHHQLGNIFMHMGVLDRALDEMQKAVALNPDNAIAQFHLAVAEGYSSNYLEALNGFTRTKEFANPSLWTYEKASVLYRVGRSAEAARMIDDYLSGHPEEDGGLIASFNAVLLASGNRRGSAERYIRIAQTARPKALIHFHHTAYNIASAYALLGRRQEAVPWMERAAADGFPCYPLFQHDHAFDRIKDDAGYKAFMASLGERWQRYRNSL